MTKSNPLVYLKAIVAIIGASLTGVVGLYGDQAWYVIAVAVLTAAATYITPNATPTVSTGDSTLED